jgi:putative acetyltransferase
VPGAPRGLRSVYPVPDDVFMVRELTPGSLADVVGLVHYHPAFAMFE